MDDQKDEKTMELNASDSDEDQKNIDDINNQISDLKEQLLRALADSENMRKRFERDKEDIIKFSAGRFAKDLLIVADTFSAALQSVTPDMEESAKSFIDGIKIAEKELITAFEKHGIKKIHPLNESFDPNYHQAMSEIEKPECKPETIIEVLQSGYSINDRILRPALVIVSK